jgi:hypothetical protein
MNSINPINPTNPRDPSNPTNPNNPNNSSTPRVNGGLDKIIKDVRILYSKEVNPVRNPSRCDPSTYLGP